MQRSLQPSSKATSTDVVERNDPTLPAILEFQSPSTAVINAPIPRSVRSVALLVSSMVIASLLVLGLIKVDRVVSAPGKVISTSATIVVQPLDTSIVRSIEVKPGDTVTEGQILARLDPTFAAADLNALTTQVSALQAQVGRMRAELDDRPFPYTGIDPNLALQAAIHAQRKAEFHYRLEGYQQKANSLASTVARARADTESYRDRLTYATSVESMRRELERLNVGSKLNTLAAMDNRTEMRRNLETAEQQANASQRDLAALIAERNGYIQGWRADLAEKLADSLGKLSDARESLNKAQLHRQLVELRAEKAGTILTVSKVSTGSVMTAGQPLITLVPSDAPLEIEANISARSDGHVMVGDHVAIKFDTFNYTQYGMAYGLVRMVSSDSFSSQDEQRNPTGAVEQPTNSGAVWYRSRISLDRIELRNVPEQFRLMPGMPVTVDIKIGYRTVLSYLLGRIIPLAQEGMREP